MSDLRSPREPLPKNPKVSGLPSPIRFLIEIVSLIGIAKICAFSSSFGTQVGGAGLRHQAGPVPVCQLVNWVLLSSRSVPLIELASRSSSKMGSCCPG